MKSISGVAVNDIRIGMLNKRLVINNPQESENECNEITENNTLGKKIWAYINVVSIDHVEVADKEYYKRIYEVIIRYKKDITEDIVFTYEGKELTIKSIVNIQEKNRFLLLECVEEVK